MPRVIHDATPNKFIFHCPGCECGHAFQTEPTPDCPHAWTWNGDYERPTVSPSINYPNPPHRCHFFVRDGMIEFLSDCDHALAGQTVAIPEW